MANSRGDTSGTHDERCIHYQGVYVSDRGESFPFFAYALLRIPRPGDDAEGLFESAGVRFNCEVLAPAEHVYLDEHQGEMRSRIIDSFARLWVAEERRAGANFSASASTPKRRRSRRERRERKELWIAIEQYLGQQGEVQRG